MCLTGLTIKSKALSLAKSQNISDFKASSGWLRRFLNRFDYTLRRITSVGRELPVNFKDVIENILSFCADNILNRERSSVFNMDETCVYLDSPGKY